MNDFNALFLLLQTCIIALLGWALRKLTVIDKTTGNFLVWQHAHDKQDDERHEELKKSIDSLWDKIDK